MNIFKRIRTVLSSLFSICMYIYLMLYPDVGIHYVINLLALGLLFYGIQQLRYYRTMARFKVGGNITLYIGIICIELSVVTFRINDVHTFMIMLYLLLYYIFIGAIHIYSALEARKISAPFWRTRLFNGIVHLIISVLCLLNFYSSRMMMYILCCGLIYSAIMRLVTACKHTAIIYIP